MGKRWRIGVLLDHIETDYHVEVLSGVRRGAARLAVDLVIVPGGELTADLLNQPRAFLYHFLPEGNIDGMVLLSGCLTNHEGRQGIVSYVERIKKVPSVSIGAYVPGTRNVFVDNVRGYQDLVEHLIVDHGYRRIAHVRGPQSSEEGDARFEGYKRALAAHGIELDERFVVPGGFVRSEGVDATRVLLDERGFRSGTLDAIACVNDETAHGVLDELARRAIGVPRPFAVVGYDDAQFAQVTNPPLSTVKQRAREQGESGLVALVEVLEGKAGLTDVPVQAPIVVRDSCGCRTRLANDSAAVAADRPRIARTCRLGLIERRSVIATMLARAAVGKIQGSRDWEGKLVDALSAQVDSPDGGAFHWEFERLARQHASHGGDALVVHDVLTTLRLQALACADVEPTMRPRLEDLFQEARLILARVALSIGQEHLDTMNQRMRVLVRSCLDQVGSPDDEALGRILAEHLPGLGIESYSIARLSEDRSFEVVAMRVPGVRPGPGMRLSSASLGIPESLEALSTLIVEPLTYNGRAVGAAVFSWGALEPTLYEELRDLLGMVLFLEGFTRTARVSDPSSLRISLAAPPSSLSPSLVPH